MMIIIITNMSSGTFIVILNRDQYEYDRLLFFFFFLQHVYGLLQH